MQGVSRTIAGIALFTTLAAAAIVLAVGGGNGQRPDITECLIMYFWITEIVVVTFLVCILNCYRDAQCEDGAFKFFLPFLSL